MSARISGLYRYIVKGCAAERLDTAEVRTEGLAEDRRFMLVEPDGSFLSQRKASGLAVLVPRLLGDRLQVSAPDTEPLEIPVRYTGSRRPVSLFNRWFGEGIDQGEEAATWFADRIGRECRLVRTPADLNRPGWGDTPGKVGFADAHAILACSTDSLAELNRRITESEGEPVPMNRFRPNIVLDGFGAPHREDRVRSMRLGGCAFAHSVRAIRCAVPTVEQSTGRRSGPEPTKTLATYRKEPELRGGVSFGVKLAVVRTGKLCVDDEVTVDDWLPEGFTAALP
ncbi:MOSC domain-containing protein [Sciscionella marina]|uniref:MOSC domain-containing protein n=1 Tax=Sciscionella marina TaxID=508770 RepID=UPI00037A92DB|nr:MOSC N-terminal beta barrel domain-containing protein [Sciscionella marina]